MTPARQAAAAFLLIAVIAVVQCVSLTHLLSGQLWDLNSTGQTRMFANRIAYLVAMARAGDPDPHWQLEVNESIRHLREVWLAGDGGAASSPAAAARTHALAARAERYIAAARALERKPNDAGAFQTIRVERPLILSEIEARMTAHAQAVADRNAVTLRQLGAGLVVQLALVALLWYRLLGRAQRRLRTSLAEVKALRDEVQALFDENPDAIAVYDDAGRLVRVNRARAQLLNATASDIIGQHWTSFVPPAVHAEAAATFERAKAGELVKWDGTLQSATGETISVEMNVFPNILNGRNRGVIAMSRDVRELRLAQAESGMMSSRLAALCRIASEHGGDWRHQIEAALALAATELDCEWGAIAEVTGDRLTFVATVGDPPGISTGATVPLTDTLTQYMLGTDDVLSIDDVANSPWPPSALHRGAPWRSLCGTTLRINGGAGGSLSIASSAPRARRLSAADRDFIKIVGTLVASIIDRARHHAKLDVMAFSDTLTGLPNRVFITEKLDALIASACGDVSFAVHFIDLDRFKHVNDNAGHAIGDEVLREIAVRFSQCVRATDVVARLGGDEFLVLQPNADGPAGAAGLAERLTAAAQQPFIFNNVAYHLSCSIGISLFPADGRDARTLLRRADEAMYRAKAKRDSVAVFAA